MKKVVVQMKRTLSVLMALMMVATTVPQAAMMVGAEEIVLENVASDEVVVEEVNSVISTDEIPLEEQTTEVRTVSVNGLGIYGEVTSAKINSQDTEVTDDDVYNVEWNDDLTLTIKAKANSKIAKVKVGTDKEKKVNKASYTLKVKVKADTVIKVTMSHSEPLVVKNGDTVIKKDSKKKAYVVEYGKTYDITKANGPEQFAIISGNSVTFTKDDAGSQSIDVKYIDTTKSPAVEKTEAVKFYVKAPTTAIKAISGAKYNKTKKIYTATQAIASEKTYKVTPKGDTTVNDLSIAVSGNGISADIIDGKITVAAKAVEVTGDVKTNTITINNAKGEAIGTFVVTLKATPKFSLKKVTGSAIALTVTAKTDKSVVVPAEGMGSMYYEVTAKKSGTVSDNLVVVSANEVAVKANKESKIVVDVEGGQKYDVSVRLIQTDVSGNVIAKTNIQKKTKVNAPAVKAEKNLKFTKNKKTPNAVVYYGEISALDDAKAHFTIATTKWSKGVNYKKISSNVIVVKKGEVSANEIVTAKIVNDKNLVVTVRAMRDEDDATEFAGKYVVKGSTLNKDGSEAGTFSYEFDVKKAANPYLELCDAYPEAVLKKLNKAVSVKSNAKKINGYTVKYSVKYATGKYDEDDYEIYASSKALTVDKNGKVTAAKAFTLPKLNTEVVVTGQVVDKSNNVLDVSYTSFDLTSRSPKFGKAIVVNEVSGNYVPVSGNVISGNTIAKGSVAQVVVLKSGVAEGAEYYTADQIISLKNVTVTTSDKKKIAVSAGNTITAKASSKSGKSYKDITITVKAKDGSGQKATLKLKVK